MRLKIKISIANALEKEAVYRLRHDVYAAELRQYEPQADGLLRDRPDTQSIYVTAMLKDHLVGFVGITSPGSPRYSVDHYLKREAISLTFDDHLYEIRALTVPHDHRGSMIFGALMYAAFRWVQSHGGTRILAIGRQEVLNLYLRFGFKRMGPSFQSGAVTYELIGAGIEEIQESLKGYEKELNRLEKQVDWQIQVAFRQPIRCVHGGDFFKAIGDQFNELERKEKVINADVLDAWFPPAPAAVEIMQKHLEWIMRTSPPTHAEGLTRTIAQVRGVESDCVLPGGGSSQLIYHALSRWLNVASRVLLLDPMYGEYAHILEKMIRCRVERFSLSRQEGYQIDIERLGRALHVEKYDMFLWVNPNSPTGRHVRAHDAKRLLETVPIGTKVWVDETYVDYTGSDQSLESFAAASSNVVICKSLSKVYALSGMRAAYLCGPASLLEELRVWMPPWSVGFPAQVAAVYALQSPDYYAGRYAETHELRRQLAEGLKSLGISEIVPSVTNFIMFHLPQESPDAQEIAARCRKQGLFIRDIGGMGSHLGRHALRIAVKDKETNQKMIAILNDSLEKIK